MLERLFVSDVSNLVNDFRRDVVKNWHRFEKPISTLEIPVDTAKLKEQAGRQETESVLSKKR